MKEGQRFEFGHKKGRAIDKKGQKKFRTGIKHVMDRRRGQGIRMREGC